MPRIQTRCRRFSFPGLLRSGHSPIRDRSIWTVFSRGRFPHRTFRCRARRGADRMVIGSVKFSGFMPEVDVSCNNT